MDTTKKKFVDVAMIAAAIPKAVTAAPGIIAAEQERTTLLVDCKALGVDVDPGTPTVLLREIRDAALKGSQ